jgi:protocatechuate 3,4-dioxygenase beta subunit
MEDQGDVLLYLDVQIIDTSSCNPVPTVYMDFWHCNSTGVYSGVVASGNGEDKDPTNINNIFLRGILQKDQNGIVQFETLFPGHYEGKYIINNQHICNLSTEQNLRSYHTHIHILTHAVNGTSVRVNGTLLSSAYNNTLTHASHVGQLFFDQDLITEVETTYPYKHQQPDHDPEFRGSDSEGEGDTTDPFVEYVLLGDKVEDGILAWISIGIDVTQHSEINSAVTKYASGGVANENSMDTGSAGGDGGTACNRAIADTMTSFVSSASLTGSLPSDSASASAQLLSE